MARWGVLDRVGASGCPAVPRATLDIGLFALTSTPPPAGETKAGYAPRQLVLTEILVEAAIAASAEFRDEFSVPTLASVGERVCGIRGHRRAGAAVSEAAGW